MKILCYLRLHKWFYNQSPLYIGEPNGATRECRHCRRIETAYLKENWQWLKKLKRTPNENPSFKNLTEVEESLAKGLV